MPYSTKADLLVDLPEKILAQLTDDINGKVVNDTVVAAKIAQADNQINSYCRGKSDLPFNTTTTPRVKDWSIALATWNLYGRRVNQEMPEPVRVAHDDVITELKAVRDNKILLNDADSPANTASFIKGDGENKGVLFDSNSEGTGALDSYYNGPL